MRGPDAEQHRVAFEQWLAADPRNRDAYKVLEDAWQDSAIAGEGMFAADRELVREQPAFRLTWTRTVVGVAAAAAAVLLMVGWPSAQQAPRPLAMAQLLQTKLGEVRRVALPDGSTITLDTNSKVDVSFSKEVRRIELLDGRARFEIAADPTRMFVVDAGDRMISAPSGRFDADVRPEGTRVSAWSDPLDIRKRGASFTSAVLFRLVPGRTIAFASGENAPLQASPAESSGDWPAGRLVFQGRPLSDVLAETNRYSRRRILLGDPLLGTLRVTGTVRPLPVDALAASLAAAFGLRVVSRPDGNIVLDRP